MHEIIIGVEKDVSKIAENGEDNRISSLLERLEEKIVFRILVRIAEYNKITELLERVSKLERMPIVVNDEKTALDSKTHCEQPRSDQEELLRKTLNDVNNRLKKL